MSPPALTLGAAHLAIQAVAVPWQQQKEQNASGAVAAPGRSAACRGGGVELAWASAACGASSAGLAEAAVSDADGAAQECAAYTSAEHASQEMENSGVRPTDCNVGSQTAAGTVGCIRAGHLPQSAAALFAEPFAAAVPHVRYTVQSLNGP